MQRNVLRQNRIVGGSYGVYWYGNTSGNNADNQLVDNFFTTQVFFAGDFRYHTGLSLEGNEVRFNTTVTVQTYGFRTLDAASGLRIVRNLMVGTGDHPYNSIRVEGGVANLPALVANNMLVSGSSTTVSTLFQIYLNNVSNIQVVHNSATLLGSAVGSSHLYAGNVSGLDLLNNNFTNAIGASVWFMDANVTLGQSNHNNLYSTAFTPFFWNGIGLSNLAAWQTTTASDANSIAVPPSFFGVDDLHTCDPALASAGIPVTGVTTDYDGETRSLISPSIGADEFAVNPVYSLGPDLQKCANASVVLSGNAVFGATYLWNTGATTPSLSVTTPGLYHVTVTTVCGSTTDSILVSSLPGPLVSFNHTVNGTTVTFTHTSPGAGLTFNWDFGDGNGAVTENPVYTYSIPGNYNVTLTVTDSCGVSNSAVQLVDANPCAPISAGFTSVINGSSVTFTQTSSGTGLVSAWDFGDGNTSNQTNPTHTYANPSTYTVLLTVTDSCGFTDTLSSQVTISTSGLATGPETVMEVYPNPSNTYVVIRSTSTETMQYRLLDQTGREAAQGVWMGGQGVLDVAQLPRATYVLELVQAGKRHVVSVVVQGP
jgi:PKD repeat protein